MLAQNFKTADELGLEPDHYEALIKLLGMFERKEIEHRELVKGDAFTDYCLPWRSPDKDFKFNMTTYAAHSSCGTVMCIHGWTQMLAGRMLPHPYEVKAAKLPRLSYYQLCHPDNKDDWNALGVEESAAALRSYLTTGASDW